ncbi:uncharacterized protein LOC119155795 [Falco rusticolus]|uniref:uncharacterized protein LOC119155795 n=1 Tax=Falco rusticolus TaxID=120794 RepID=UPI0018866525|nr:uncharacterized protein LOC119155795 [Falco rusticolus]
MSSTMPIMIRPALTVMVCHHCAGAHPALTWALARSPLAVLRQVGAQRCPGRPTNQQRKSRARKIKGIRQALLAVTYILPSALAALRQAAAARLRGAPAHRPTPPTRRNGGETPPQLGAQTGAGAAAPGAEAPPPADTAAYECCSLSAENAGVPEVCLSSALIWPQGPVTSLKRYRWEDSPAGHLPGPSWRVTHMSSEESFLPSTSPTWKTCKPEVPFLDLAHCTYKLELEIIP